MIYASSDGMRHRLGVLHAHQRMEARQRVMQAAVDGEINLARVMSSAGIKSPARLADFFQAKAQPWKTNPQAAAVAYPYGLPNTNVGTVTGPEGAGQVEGQQQQGGAEEPQMRIGAVAGVSLGGPLAGSFNAEDASYTARSHATPRATAAALLKFAKDKAERERQEGNAEGQGEGEGGEGEGQGEGEQGLEGVPEEAGAGEGVEGVAAPVEADPTLAA